MTTVILLELHPTVPTITGKTLLVVVTVGVRNYALLVRGFVLFSYHVEIILPVLRELH